MNEREPDITVEAPREPDVEVADVTLREHGQTVTAEGLATFGVDLRVRTALALAAAGLRRLELVSCVSPQVAPAMEEALIREVAEGVGRPPGVRLVTLVPNRRGFETFRRAGLGARGLGHTAGLFLSAVEEHNRANLGRPISETFTEYRALVTALRRADTELVAYVSAAFGFRPRAVDKVLRVPEDALYDHVMRFFDLGAVTVTLSDLQGVAGPARTHDTLAALAERMGPDHAARLGYHPHHPDPEAGLALVDAAYDAGVRRFDASLGATGGCVTGAPGNVPTEGVLAVLEARGARTGIRRAAVLDAAEAFVVASTSEESS
jgi:hydroxymethylglutaryl-CoA lyase